MRNPHNDPLSFAPLNVSVTPELLRGWRNRARGDRSIGQHVRTPSVTPDLFRGPHGRVRGAVNLLRRPQSHDESRNKPGMTTRARPDRRDGMIQPTIDSCFSDHMARTLPSSVGPDILSPFPAKFPATGTAAGKIARASLGNRGTTLFVTPDLFRGPRSRMRGAASLFRPSQPHGGSRNKSGMTGRAPHG
jgi:hypothetical protein